jgi:tetratricopeptide (TPR) repeat protein
MNARLPRKVALLLAVSFLAAGCSEVRGRRKVQEGNRLYRDGHYKEAVDVFAQAEQFVPNLPQLWLNKGYTCRQMLVPGAHTDESTFAAKCAKDAFERYQKLAPQDPRGEMLYVQTLFDSDEFDMLAKMYEERFKKNPRDIEALNGLIQVYSKWNKLDEALEWYGRKAEVLANDPEAQYGAGVFIYTQLFQKGGGPEKSTHDPRPDPNKPRAVKDHPPFTMGDIISQQRVDLADTGIKYLEKAVALRPKYHEAMTYINLLYRQKSYAYFDYPDDWQKCVDEAVQWAGKSFEARGLAVPDSLKNAIEQAKDRQAAAASGKKLPAAKADKKGKGGKRGKGGKGGKRGANALVGFEESGDGFRAVSYPGQAATQEVVAHHVHVLGRPARRSAGRGRGLLLLARGGAVPAERQRDLPGGCAASAASASAAQEEEVGHQDRQADRNRSAQAEPDRSAQGKAARARRRG